MSQVPKDLYILPEQMSRWDVRELPRDLSDVITEAQRIGTLLGGQAANCRQLPIEEIDLCNLAVELYTTQAFKGDGKVPKQIEDAFAEAFMKNMYFFDLLTPMSD